MTDTEIKLIRYAETGKDEMAQPIRSRIETPVLAQDVPVSRMDFYSGGQAGIRPEFEFVINPAEYNGEEEVEIVNPDHTVTCLQIVRTYERSADELEIYCQKESGLNPKPSVTESQVEGM